MSVTFACAKKKFPQKMDRSSWCVVVQSVVPGQPPAVVLWEGTCRGPGRSHGRSACTTRTSISVEDQSSVSAGYSLLLTASMGEYIMQKRLRAGLYWFCVGPDWFVIVYCWSRMVLCWSRLVYNGLVLV